MKPMEIKELAYELYKCNWEANHYVFQQKKMRAFKDYYRYCQKAEQTCTFEEWLGEFGYNGELFACKEEFLANEYLDESYVKQLLNDDILFNQYQESRTKESE